MKNTFAPSTSRNGKQRVPAGLVMAIVMLCQQSATAALMAVDLGTTSGFAVLAGSGITVAGSVHSTTINGDMGTFPTDSITGLGNVMLNGVNQAGDAVTQGAKSDLVAAYNDAAGRLPTVSFGPIYDLGGLTFAPGVYADPSSFGLTGALTLDAQGDPNAVWIFQAGSTLITSSNSKVILTGGAQADNIFWQVGSSATLGTDSQFAGNILSMESITLNTGATVAGRVLARDGAVTFDHNVVLIPEPGSLLLLGCGLAPWLAKRRRRVG